MNRVRGQGGVFIGNPDDKPEQKVLPLELDQATLQSIALGSIGNA